MLKSVLRFLHNGEVRFLQEILIDIETYSEVDIGKCGLYRYATDPSTEILLIAWATDEGSGFGETQCVDIATGEPFPQELLAAFKDSSVKLMDGMSPLEIELPGPLNALKKPLLRVVKGTVVEKLLRDHNVIKDGMLD